MGWDGMEGVPLQVNDDSLSYSHVHHLLAATQQPSIHKESALDRCFLSSLWCHECVLSSLS